MNILLDQGLPRLAAVELRRLGFDVVHTADVGMAAATDDELLVFALQLWHPDVRGARRLALRTAPDTLAPSPAG